MIPFLPVRPSGFGVPFPQDADGGRLRPVGEGGSQGTRIPQFARSKPVEIG
jgi:hypothetical protein